MEAKRAADTRMQMAQVVTPNHANMYGKAFGGAILSMIDLLAYTVASRFAGNVCVTASFDRVDFIRPIEIGDVVVLTGFVSYAGRTSVEVTVEVEAEDVLTGERRHTNTARVTMVAIKDGKPTPVPRLLCETHEEKIRFLEGKARREQRSQREAERRAIHESLERLGEAELDRLIGGGSD
ncbi:MAG: acyl-CoA thioesterase [Fimbriimonadales bacterium]|nr:acyl-CoA thioesterase [Fimbriimonadales bacterium]